MKTGNILQQWRTRLLSIPLFRRPLQVVLLLAFINGLLYFLLVPAWWHYDEPGQFEYVWLAANRPAWPKAGEHDEAMRREMAHSMQRSGWYALRNYTPDFSSSKSIWIGAPQTGGQPAYYFVASLPLRLMRGADITLQYDVVRLTSLLLYVLTILVIWKALGELVPEGHALQWIVTGFIALLPAFADIMTSVNDDVGAVLVSCIFLWLSFQLIKRGFSIVRLLFWGITLALCYLTKNTTWFAFAVAPFVLLAALLRGRMSRLLWAIAALLVLAAAADHIRRRRLGLLVSKSYADPSLEADNSSRRSWNSRLSDRLLHRKNAAADRAVSERRSDQIVTRQNGYAGSVDLGGRARPGQSARSSIRHTRSGLCRHCEGASETAAQADLLPDRRSGAF